MKDTFNNDEFYPINDELITVVQLEEDDFFDYSMVDFRTKTLILGDGIDSFSNEQGVLCDSEIESLMLEGKHEAIVLIDGILYEKIDYSFYLDRDSHQDNENISQNDVSKLSLLFIPPKMKIRKYIVPSLCVDFSTFSISNDYLEEIVFHDHFLSMDDICFSGCERLKTIHLPKSITCICEYPLNIVGLEKITVDAENKNFIVKNNSLLNFDGTELIVIPSGLKEDIYEIPEGVIRAEEYSPDNYYIKKLVIPDTISSFTDYALCKGNSMMYCFPSLDEIIAKASNPYFVSVDGVLYNKDFTKLIHYPNDKQGEEYILLDTCVSFEVSAFVNPAYVRKIYISNQTFFCDSLEDSMSLGMDADIEFYLRIDEGYVLIDFDYVTAEKL